MVLVGFKPDLDDQLVSFSTLTLLAWLSGLFIYFRIYGIVVSGVLARLSNIIMALEGAWIAQCLASSGSVPTKTPVRIPAAQKVMGTDRICQYLRI